MGSSRTRTKPGHAHRIPRSDDLRRGRGSRWAALTLLLSACDPTLVVGSSSCPPSVRAGESGFQPGVAKEDPLPVPWRTDFESGFCGYALALGFCYADDFSSFEIVDGPAHSGQRAAAFTIFPVEQFGKQTRCVREGVMPRSATYGAWYYLPSKPTMTDNWNLLHFNGVTGQQPLHGLWDVSVRLGGDGELYLFIHDFLGSAGPIPDSTVPVPLNRWFHIEVSLVRAADMTGSITLRQDGEELFSTDSIITDDSDWGQWYVGNLADALTPADSTVYVDDISIVPNP